jgi:hypothetical protein
MKADKTDIELEQQLLKEVIDSVYACYEGEHSLQSVMSIHPMFFNGTFTEDNSYQPPTPDPLMSKQEFIKTIESESEDNRWKTAITVLYLYLLKNLK